MDAYKIPIQVAIITFPFIAFILTIPFLIYQYRKYGAIPILKSIIFYSFILYLITAYYMVMLPLPAIEYVKNLKTPYTQLIPFQFIKDITTTVSFDVTNVEDFLKIFNNSTIYVVVFNFLLTLPLGVYLKYYFNKKWYQTIIYSFLLSLFFELTQLSGLYGIYPRPYRLFDVDDLIINTLGGYFGHLITPLLTIFLPTNKELESISYKKGEKVTLLRRILAFAIDIFLIALINIITSILFYNSPFFFYSNLISILIYYIFFPLIGHGNTIGKKVLKLDLTSIKGKKKWYTIFLRYLLLIFFIIYPYAVIDLMTTKKVPELIINIYDVTAEMFVIINILYYIFISKKDEKIFLYEKITNTRNISIVTREENDAVIEEQENKENEQQDDKICYNEKKKNNLKNGGGKNG